MKIKCNVCEIADGCKNKPQSECFNYMMFKPKSSKKLKLIKKPTEKLPTTITEDENGNLIIPDDYSMGECQFCGRVDGDLDYIKISPNIYVCNECAEGLKDNDKETNTLVDMLFEAEKYARTKKVNKELCAVLFTFVQAIKDACNGKTNALMDLTAGSKAISTREAKRMLVDKKIIDD